MSDVEEKYGVIYEKREYAGFTKRVLIAAVDMLVIGVYSLACLFITGHFLKDGETYLKFNFFLILFLSVFYLAILKRSKYRTVGYIITKVKIVDLQGKRPSIFKMIFRTFLLLIGPFSFIIDILWIWSEATKQTLRDKFVGTYVVNQNAVPLGKGRIQNVTLGIMGWNLMYQEVKESGLK